jgi:molybdopterin-guanine dinucleotide biosynthesis protein A
MGEPKAGAMLAGRPMIAYPIDAVRAAGLDPVVVVKPQTPLPDLACEVFHERDERRHPAAGILAALRAGDGGPVVVVACDMPFVETELIRFLAGLEATVAVPRVGGRLEPLLARYSTPAIPALEAAIAGRYALAEAIEGRDTVVVDEQELARFGDPARMTSNVNDRAELASAERRLARSVAR